RRDDELTLRRDRAPGERAQFVGEAIAELRAAAVLGVGLRSAAMHAFDELFERARRGREGRRVDVAVREIDRHAGDRLAVQGGIRGVVTLANFLTWRVIGAELRELLFDGRHAA